MELNSLFKVYCLLHVNFHNSCQGKCIAIWNPVCKFISTYSGWCYFFVIWGIFQVQLIDVPVLSYARNFCLSPLQVLPPIQVLSWIRKCITCTPPCLLWLLGNWPFHRKSLPITSTWTHITTFKGYIAAQIAQKVKVMVFKPRLGRDTLWSYQVIPNHLIHWYLKDYRVYSYHLQWLNQLSPHAWGNKRSCRLCLSSEVIVSSLET